MSASLNGNAHEGEGTYIRLCNINSADLKVRSVIEASIQTFSESNRNGGRFCQVCNLLSLCGKKRF